MSLGAIGLHGKVAEGNVRTYPGNSFDHCEKIKFCDYNYIALKFNLVSSVPNNYEIYVYNFTHSILSTDRSR